MRNRNLMLILAGIILISSSFCAMLTFPAWHECRMAHGFWHCWADLQWLNFNKAI